MKKHSIRNSLKAAVAAFALGAACAHGAPIFVPGDQPFGDVPQLALTGFNLSTGTQKAFQVYFSNASFSGDVVAYPVGIDGRTQLQDRIWSATDVFNNSQACGTASDPSTATADYWNVDRNIVTRNATKNIAFRWPAIPATPTVDELTTTQITALKASGTDAVGESRLNFIRGDRSNEIFQKVVDDEGTEVFTCGIALGIFRARVSILGDTLHTRPVFVGAPPADFTFDSYATFKTNNASRAARLYVGANDGMVHAFDANSGIEQFAYIPSMLVPKLAALSVPAYVHTYFVDGQMTAGDVNFGTSGSPDWRTVLVGGLGAGGKGLFALDITGATVADEAAAKAKILWEITPSSTGYGDLGYTYGTPVIARMNNGKWAVIVNNGYLNAGTGHAVLYIIDITDGTLISSLDTGSGTLLSPNGLSSPIAIDTTFDGKIDRIYAGDIDGNLWKFDVSGATAADWIAPTTALFPTATDLAAPNNVVAQAIIGAPDVAAHPISGFLVYFATGRMYTAGDAVGTAAAAVKNHAHGLWDGAPIANTTFLKQTLTEKSHGSQRVRVSSGLAINWNDATDTVTKPLHKGWRTELWPTPLPTTPLPLRTATAGERVIGTGFVRDARYQFTALNPVIAHTALPDGENWLIELDYLTGGAADKPIFDLTADSLLTDADRAKYVAADTLPTGKAIGDPIAGPVGIPVAVYMGAGLISQPVLANVSAQLSTTLFNDNNKISPAEVPQVPPAVIADRGVFGGHFDVEIYRKNSGGYICNYEDNPATKASVTLTFTYSGNKTADSLSIKINGVEAMDSGGKTPGSKSRNNLGSHVRSTGNQTTSFKNDWDASGNNNVVTFTADDNGAVWNNLTVVISTGAGMSSSDYTVKTSGGALTTVTTGGADVTRGLMETGTACYRKEHVHEYDELYNVTGVDMLNASDSDYNLVKAIPSTSTPFKVLVSNQYLNPAVTLSIGGAPHVSIKNFMIGTTLDVGTLPTYTRANIGSFEFNMPTDAFAIKDWWTGNPPAVCSTDTSASDCRSGLLPTAPSCVYEASRTQGGSLFKPIIPRAFGEDGSGTKNWVNSSPYTGSTGVRHGGALTFTVIRNTTPQSALELNDSLGRGEFGWRLKEAVFEDYVLAEYTVFQHYVWRDTNGDDFTRQSAADAAAGLPLGTKAPVYSGVCYGETNWTKKPIANTSPGEPLVGDAALGSSDPGAGTPRATFTVGTPTVTPDSGGGTTTVVTTTFSDGSSLVVTTTTTSGGVSTTTSTFVEAASGSPSNVSGTPGIGQAVASPNTITGYQQTRNSGKLGRVTWHELLRQ